MDDEEKDAADSFQNKVPTARVNIRLDLHTDSVKEKAELPLKLSTVGDYGNGKEQRPLSKRDKVDINKDNLSSVMAKLSSAVNPTVEDTLNGDGNEQSITLEFKSLKDFKPEQVAKNIPQFRVLLAVRNLLCDLKSNLLDNTTFCRELKNILENPVFNSEPRDELTKIAPQEGV